MRSKLQMTNTTISIVAALLLWGASASAQVVTWDTENSHANGTGCNDDNTIFMAVGGTVTLPGGLVIAGGQLEIMFSDMGVDLPVGPGTGLKNCLAASRANINPAGKTSLLFTLQQELEWGWVKQYASSTGTVSLTANFCGMKMPSLTTQTPPVAGASIDIFTSAPVAAAITPLPTQCLYRANISVAAKGPGPMSIGVYGETVDLYVVFIGDPESPHRG